MAEKTAPEAPVLAEHAQFLIDTAARAELSRHAAGRCCGMASVLPVPPGRTR